MRKGFTLVEMMIGVAILSVMTVALFEVYSSVSVANRRLDRSRELTSAVRIVTEEIARDVKDRGIDFSAYDEEAPRVGKTDAAAFLDWNGSGTTILMVNGGIIYRNRYDASTTWKDCDVTHSGACFLTRTKGDEPEERLTSTSVTLKSLKFFISGGSKGAGAVPGKVVIVGDVDLIKSLKETYSSPSVAFQTTVAERPYNRNQ